MDSMHVDGRCHCGAITYSATIDPGKVMVCHCTDCQTLGGTAFRMSVPVPASDFRLLSGAPAIYVKTAASGNRRVQAFCGSCGTPLYACDAEQPKVLAVRTGALRQRASLAPKRQIWFKSALGWIMDIPGIAHTDEE